MIENPLTIVIILGVLVTLIKVFKAIKEMEPDEIMFRWGIAMIVLLVVYFSLVNMPNLDLATKLGKTYHENFAIPQIKSSLKELFWTMVSLGFLVPCYAAYKYLRDKDDY
ncbi:hypothetical protein [Vibrio harveyi]|uniref:hypothetical protein n=1 Tax=Vibrio harveyi TaxID=669 RepID=UPI003CEF9B15